MDKKKNRIIITLCLLLFMLLIPLLFQSNNQLSSTSNDVDLEASAINYLFNSKNYTFNLDDFYDDAILNKTFTGAEFQTEWFNNTELAWSGTYDNDTVLPVNNTNTKSPSDTDVTMIDGTFDDTDNMKANDGSYSDFISTEGGYYAGTYTFDTDAVGAAPAGWTDNDGAGTESSVIAYLDGHRKVLEQEDNNGATYARLWQLFTAGAQTTGTIEFWMRTEDHTISTYFIPMSAGGLTLMEVAFWGGDITAYNGGGRTVIIADPNDDQWYHIRMDFRSNAGGAYMGLAAETYWVYVDGVQYGPYGFCNGRNDAVARIQMMTLPAGSGWSWYVDSIGYLWDGGYDIGDNLIVPSISELDYIIDLNFDEVLLEDLLAVDVSSHHYTNVSTTIDASIYNYDTTAYVEMFSTAVTAEAHHYYMDDAILDDFLNGAGNLQLRFNGTNVASDFEMNVDYIVVTFYYKLDLEHIKTFYTNGVYRYRWEITGSIHYTQWVTFEVIDPVSNFYAISESDYTTRWILQNSTLSPIEDFHDNISINYWDLIEVSDIAFNYSTITSADSWIYDELPTTNYGSSYQLVAQDNAGPSVGKSYFRFSDLYLNYLFDNQTGGYGIGVYVYQTTSFPTSSYQLHNTSSFVENTITWNFAPAEDTHQDTVAISSTGWEYFTVNNLSEYYIISYAAGSGFIYMYSKEYPSLEPIFIQYDVNKNYFGGGYTYIQTDTTESIGLRSIDYTTHYNLSSGDYFEIDFQTSSDSQIDLLLYQDGVLNKSLVLSASGNTNFNNQTAQISADEYCEFDQIKISSTLEDTDYVRVYDIKTYKYTVIGDYADFYVGSKNDYSIYLTPDVYNLRIIESDIEVINENITIPATGIKQYVYTPEPLITKTECLLTLFPVGGGLSLMFADYIIYVNRSYNGVYERFLLNEEIFEADELTTVYIDVYDRFQLLIGTFPEPIAIRINLELNVYSLQIKNLMEQKTTVDINTTHTYPLLSGDSIYFVLSEAQYVIGYFDTNDVYKQFTIDLNSNQAYELNRSKICFLSYADQRGNYLSFDNYRTYINGSQIYENIFYKEIGDSINITVNDRYNISIHSEIYDVVSGDNYIPITLTMYSLKVMNLQEVFNWINISRDPLEYESDMYWSEWIAPNEIIDFRLFTGDYIINLTNNEDSGHSVYSYTLSGDDVILIGSDNTIATVIYNLDNVNTTIGNQITLVEINITNQNSQINNSVIQIEINIESINSSLGTMLVNLGLNITNIANNISSLYVFTNNSFINLDNAINTSFIWLENNIITFNTSISNLVIGVSNEIYLINGTISTMITSLETNLLLMNITIDTALFNLGTTIDIIGANITSNYILLNNSIDLTNVNINDSRIAMINNLLLVNSTISTLVSQVYSAVYLINNSIYTAVVDLGTYLSLINNTISGNLSIVLEQNEFLTGIYQMTMFSDLLNWTNIGLNTSLLTTQIDVWSFINDWRNQSIEVHLRYNDIIDNLTISAQNTIEQYLPASGVEYNLWSVTDEEYLDEWVDLPDNKTVNFGFYETEVPIVPLPQFIEALQQWSIAIVFIMIFAVIAIVIYYKLKLDKVKEKKKNPNGYMPPSRLQKTPYY